MAKQTFSVGQVLSAAQMTSLQATAMGGGAAVTKTASYTLVAADAGTVIQMNSASPTTITVNTALFAAGDTVQIQNIGAGACTVTAGTATVNTSGSLILAQYQGGILYFNTTSAAFFYQYATPESGDITAVTAGTGISGGGTSGAVTITNSMATEITAAGDIIVGTGSGTFDNLPIGTTGQVLTADTTVSPYKVKWATASSGSTFVGVKVTKSADQTIASATEAQITWNQEDFDTDGFHDNSTNNSRLTVPSGKGGYYKIYAEMQWQNTSSTARKIIAVYLNGAVTQIGTFETGSIGFPSCIVSFTQNLSAGDYIQLYAYNGTAGNLDFRSSLAFFGMEKIG